MDIIFNLFKVRFKVLEDLIKKEEIMIQKNSKVNIFINLDCVFNYLASSPSLENELQIMNDKRKAYMMISNIINLAAHYRLFFSKNQIYSNVFIYTTFPFNANVKNKDYFPEYRYPYSSKFTNKPSNILLSNLIEDNIDLASMILEYIKGVYFIQSRSFENSLVPELVIDEKPGFLNFLVTTDPYDYQYVNKGFVIVHPKKEESFLVTRNNLWEQIGMGSKINASLYSFVLSVTGNKLRGLPKIKGMGIKSVIKVLEKALDSKVISNEVTNIGMLIRLIRDEYVEMVLTNYHCIDLDFQKSYVHMSAKLEIVKQLVDKFDNLGLQELSNQYFKEYPLNLEEITDAYRLERSNIKVRSSIW